MGIITERDIEEKCGRRECSLRGLRARTNPLDWLTSGAQPSSKEIAELAETYGQLAGTSVDEVMTRAVVTAAGDDDVTSILAKMAKSKVNHIPVVDASGRLLGIVARGDVISGLMTLRLAGQPAKE